MIKVSFCSLSLSTEETEALISSLPFGDTEKQRLRSMRNRSAHLESLSALCALGALISPSEHLTISRHAGGKPFFVSYPLFFSLSHADGLGIAVLSSSEVGIDLEWTDAPRNISAISRRFFSPSELRQIDSAENASFEFFSIWTKKEAYAKFTGEGLASVCSLPDVSSKKFKQFILASGTRQAVISICYETDGEEISFCGLPEGYSLCEI